MDGGLKGSKFQVTLKSKCQKFLCRSEAQRFRRSGLFCGDLRLMMLAVFVMHRVKHRILLGTVVLKKSQVDRINSHIL